MRGISEDMINVVVATCGDGGGVNLVRQNFGDNLVLLH